MEIEEAWFRNNTRSSSNIMRQQDYYSSTIPSPNTLNLDSFRGLFLVSGLSSALALLIFLICNLRPHVKDYILRNLFLGKLLFMLRHIYIEEILLPWCKCLREDEWWSFHRVDRVISCPIWYAFLYRFFGNSTTANCLFEFRPRGDFCTCNFRFVNLVCEQNIEENEDSNRSVPRKIVS